MRVSKTVREYIEKRVSEKLEVKYAPEKEQAEEQRKIRDDILEAASCAASQAFAAVIEEQGFGHDFLQANPDRFPNCYNSYALTIAGAQYLSNVQNWQRRMEKERDEIVRNIVVELELGGTKADLERLLAEI